jgi:hypothetical protein
LLISALPWLESLLLYILLSSFLVSYLSHSSSRSFLSWELRGGGMRVGEG